MINYLIIVFISALFIGIINKKTLIGIISINTLNGNLFLEYLIEN